MGSTEDGKRSSRWPGKGMVLTALALAILLPCAFEPRAAEIATASGGASVVVTPLESSWRDDRRWNLIPMSRWEVGQPTDCHLCPQRLFVIVCEPRELGHIRNLDRFSGLSESFRSDPSAWAKEMAPAYPCIADPSFRLPSRAGNREGTGDDELPYGIAYQVMEQDPDGQVVEVRYWQGVDILDSFFRYRMEKGRVIPLESWVVTRGHVAMLIAEVIVLVTLLAVLGLGFWIYRRLRRHWKARGGSDDAGTGA